MQNGWLKLFDVLKLRRLRAQAAAPPVFHTLHRWPSARATSC
jgi:hypothetical protein